MFVQASVPQYVGFSTGRLYVLMTWLLASLRASDRGGEVMTETVIFYNNLRNGMPSFPPYAIGQTDQLWSTVRKEALKTRRQGSLRAILEAGYHTLTLAVLKLSNTDLGFIIFSNHFK